MNASTHTMTNALPAQLELPIAIVDGKPFTEMPSDLYIPPEALEVILESFEGPLDLLLYLIKRQNLDILNIEVAEITRQYMKYVEVMKEMQLELAAEYLVMAAMLAEIKSRLLLPRPTNCEADESDPRAELIKRLLEYERIKQAAESLDRLPQQGRDVFVVQAERPDTPVKKNLPTVTMDELLNSLREVMQRAAMFTHHAITRETLSIRERMSQILTKISSDKFTHFNQLFTAEEGRLGVVVTFIAILELIRQSLIELVQAEPYAPIHVKAVSP
jgi:segregation and condensation protein A